MVVEIFLPLNVCEPTTAFRRTGALIPSLSQAKFIANKYKTVDFIDICKDESAGIQVDLVTGRQKENAAYSF